MKAIDFLARRRSGALAVLALLGAAAGCDANPANAPRAGASAALPLVAYVQDAANGFELRLLQPGAKTSERVELMTERPEVIVWRTDKPEVITVRGDGVYATPYQNKPYASSSLADAAPKGLAPRDGWIAADGRSLHVVASSAAATGAKTCAVYAPPPSGLWRRLDSPAAAPAGDDEDCERYADRHRHAALSASTASLMRGYRCSAATSICSTLGSPRQAPAETLYQTLAKGHESVAVADPGSSKFYVVMGVGVGDTPHLTAPVYLVRRSNQSAVKPALKTGPQVQLALQGALALIGAEYSGADALLVDLEAGAATALSGRGSFGAVWVPVPASPKTRKGSVAIGPQR